MKTIGDIIKEVLQYNADSSSAGKKVVYVPAEFVGDMAEQRMYTDGIGEVLTETLDGQVERELRALISGAIRKDDGVEYYADCVRIGDLICDALRWHADRTIRSTIARRERLDKSVQL